jgi:hypothetical protein
MGSISFEQAKDYGFNFGPQARGWYSKEDVGRLAQDAALITNPNTTLPVELLAYIDPRVIEIMTAPRNAREIFTETRKGTWTTPYEKWRTDEIVGRTQPYSDWADNGVSDVNSNWKVREQYLFQTVIQYGDLESAASGVALINLAADKQRAAATVIDIDANKFYLLGVANKEIYGLLNDPDLPAAIAAASNGAASPSTAWADKSTVQIYNDILALFSELTDNSAGLITSDTRLVLAVSPAASVHLGAATDFNVSVKDMISKYFRDIRIVALPELGGAVQKAFLIAPEVAGMNTGELGYGEKILAGRVVPELSALKQKYVSGTYGGLVLVPFAFAQMTGIGA